MTTEVRDEERLARFCDRSAVKASGAVHFKAFVATRFPAELSVDRIELSKPDERAERETTMLGHRRTFVVLVSGEARAIPRVLVHARPLTCPPEPYDAPEHAEIHIGHDASPDTLQSKEAMIAAQIWAQHVEVCDNLAKIARARDCDKPKAN